MQLSEGSSRFNLYTFKIAFTEMPKRIYQILKGYTKFDLKAWIIPHPHFSLHVALDGKRKAQGKRKAHIMCDSRGHGRVQHGHSCPPF